MITTIGYDQYKMIADIIGLYCPNGIELDPTYSTGQFYKTGDVKEPTLRLDICPQTDGCDQADVRQLPLPDSCVDSVMFDPPFVGGSRKNGKPGIIKTRFSYYKSIPVLWEFYNDALKELNRVMAKNGILVFKCQDSVEGGKQWWSHIRVYDMATEIGLIAEDLFILLAKNRLMSPNMRIQQHARKFHSYFWVFRKVLGS